MLRILSALKELGQTQKRLPPILLDLQQHLHSDGQFQTHEIHEEQPHQGGVIDMLGSKSDMGEQELMDATSIDESLADRLRMPPWSYMNNDDVGFVDFRGLESWEEVERAVMALGPRFNKYHAAAAFSRLRFVPQPTEKPFLHELMGKTRLLIDDMGPHHLLLTFYSTVRLDVECSDFLDCIAEKVMSLNRSLFVTTNLLTNVMFSLGLARKRRSRSLEVEHKDEPVLASEFTFMKFLLDVLKEEERLVDFSCADCSRLIYSLAQYQHMTQADDPFLQRVCNHLSKVGVLSSMNEISCILLLTSLTSLGLYHRPLLVKLLQHMADNRTLIMYENTELVTIVYCLGMLHHWDEDIILLVMRELLKPERLAEISDQGISNFLHGLACHEQMQSFDKEYFLLPFFREAAQEHRLKNYIGLGLTGVLYSAGRLGYPSGRHASVLLPLAQEMVSPSRLPTLSNQGLSVALWGMAKVGLKDVNVIDQILTEAIRPERLVTSPEPGLSLILYSCGALEYRNSTLLRAVLRELIKPEKLGAISDRNMSHIAYGLGRTNCIPVEDVLHFVKACVKPKRLASFDTKHLCSVLQMATILGHRNLDDLKRIVKEITKPERLMNIDPLELQDTLIGMNKSPGLMWLPEATVLLQAAMKSEFLKSSGEPRISALATVMSMHRSLIKLPMDVVQRFAEEVTSPERLGRFNPIDLTSVYITLARFGIHEESKLVSLLDALDRKQPSSQRRSNQFLSAIAATNGVQDCELHSLLLQKMLRHMLKEGCISVFRASDAFSMVSALVASRPNLSTRPTWTEAVERFAVIAKSGDLSTIPTHLLVQRATAMLNHATPLPANIDFAEVVLNGLCARHRTQESTMGQLMKLVDTVARFSIATMDQRTDALQSLMVAIRQSGKLSTFRRSHADRLISLDRDFAFFSDADRTDLLIEAGAPERRKDEVVACAMEMESMFGCADD